MYDKKKKSKVLEMAYMLYTIQLSIMSELISYSSPTKPFCPLSLQPAGDYFRNFVFTVPSGYNIPPVDIEWHIPHLFTI